MATKTITLELDTSKRLKQAKRGNESFSAVVRRAAVFRRRLRMDGQLIGDSNILIAATAVSEGLPLVTDIHEHFSRLHELDIASH